MATSYKLRFLLLLFRRVSDFERDYQSFAELVAGWLDWHGPVFTVSTACTSSLNALLSARTLIRNGHADHALVLGVELRNRVSIAGFGGMQLLSADRALPLGKHRDGLVLGEAVAALHVSSRPSRWRIAGGANVVEGEDPAGTVPEAVVAMCSEALASSALAPRDIALIKPQAAGGPVNDATEARALRLMLPSTTMHPATAPTFGTRNTSRTSALPSIFSFSTFSSMPIIAALISSSTL